MRRIVKVFFSNTLQAMPDDRESIAAFINMMNSRLSRFNVFFSQVYCDYEETPMGEMPSSESIKNALKGCSAAFFVINFEIDQMTEAEFETAYEKFQELSDPRIIVLFKNSNPAVLQQRAASFEEKLRTELNHYYGFAEQPEQLKLRLLIELTLNMPGLILDIKDGICYVNDQEISDMREAAFYKNHVKLQQLKEEYNNLEEEFLRLSKARDRKVFAISERMNQIQEETAEIESGIMAIFQRVYVEAGKNRMTPLLKRASLFLERGDIETANEILSNDAVFQQSNRTRSRARVFKIEKQQEVTDILFSIDTKLKSSLDTRYTEVQELFEEAVSNEKEFNLPPVAFPRYVNFLFQQQMLPRAIEVCEGYCHFIQLKQPLDFAALAESRRLLGDLKYRSRQYDAAKKDYEIAYELYEDLSPENLAESSYAANKKSIKEALDLMAREHSQ